MLKFDFVKNSEELYVCTKISEGEMSFLVIYVDNIILIKNDIRVDGANKTIVIHAILDKEFERNIIRIGNTHL